MAKRSKGTFRYAYDLQEYGYPEVYLFGAYRVTKAFSPIRDHAHPGFEICFLAEGRQNYSVSGRDYLLKKNDVFMTLPGEYHSSGKQPQEKGALYWINLHPARQILGLSAAASELILDSLSAIREKRFAGSESMLRQLEHIHNLLQMPKTGMGSIEIAGTLVLFLLELIRCSAHARPETDSSMNTVIRYIGDNIEKNIRVPELAARMNLSESWFKARFKKETGLSPAEYVMRHKIAEAKEFLKRGDGNVTEAAMKYGFYSSQHFALTFRKYTNRKPSEFLEKIREQIPPKRQMRLYSE